jgi:hypothetical protein
MNATRPFTMLLAAFLVLAFAQPVLANVIAPTAYFWPGIFPGSTVLAVLASVLAAVLERPFLTRAGVTHHAMLYALQANAISLVIGYVTLPVGWYAIYTIGPLWSLVAVGMSVVSEGLYCRMRATNGGRLRWGYIICGNVFSSFVLLTLPYLSMIVGQTNPRLFRRIEPYVETLTWASAIVGAAVFVLSFYLPGILGRRQTKGDAEFESFLPAPVATSDRNEETGAARRN